MKLRNICFVFFLIWSPVLAAKTAEKVPVESERISPRVLLVKCGRVYKDQVIAIASKKGIVVIDTGKTPSLAQEYRKTIEKEFGRSDFRYVINTHYHFDHSNGNQVYPEAEIIAQEQSPAGMRSFEQNLEEFIQGRRDLKAQFQSQLDKAEPGSNQAISANDIVYHLDLMIEDLQSNFTATYPTITFRDRMTLDLDDIHLRLVYFGEGRHTGDDIIIHCPEEKLLFTGDLFFGRSFQIAFSPRFDAERWIRALDYILEDKDAVQWVFDTHNARMPGSFITLWRKYLVDLYASVKKAKSEGWELDTAKEKLSYKSRFSYIAQSGIPEAQLEAGHRQDLNYMWYKLHGMISAVSVLQPVLDGSSTDALVLKFREMRSKEQDRYYYQENEFNQWGYRLLGENNTQAAIAVFKITVELFPESWNAFDSLGEAYMTGGNKASAIDNYEKSLALNPDNTNAVEKLKILRK